MADWLSKNGFFCRRAAALGSPRVACLLSTVVVVVCLALACGQAPPMRPVGPALAKSSPTEESRDAGADGEAANKGGRSVSSADPATAQAPPQSGGVGGALAPQGALPESSTGGAQSMTADTAPVSQTPLGSGETTTTSGPAEAPSQPATALPGPAPIPADAGGWLLYHAEVQSCYPSYSGPSLLLVGGSGQVDTSKFGSSLPYCDASRKGQAFCTSRPDGSPSNCFMCEDNLFLCP